MKILEYKAPRRTISKISDEYKTKYETLKHYAKYPYNIQDHATFINEAGLYELVIKSKMRQAVKFKKWITQDVIPGIRKSGKYEISENDKKKVEALNDELDLYKKRIMILENNQKREKYPKGGYIYIIKPPEIIKTDLPMHKIGKVDESMNDRLNAYDTTIPDKVIVVDKVKVESPIPVEMCVKAFLYDYRYRNGKEYYNLDAESILKVIHRCNDMICGDKNERAVKRNLPDLVLTRTTDEIHGIMAVTKEQEEDNMKYVNKSQHGGKTSYQSLYTENKRMYAELLG